MRRETSNRIRFIIEDLLPPLVKDGRLFGLVARAAFGPSVDDAKRFRNQAPFLTEEQYEQYYRDWRGPHGETDNSQACIDRITQDVVGDSVCDVGCGTGYLLRHLRDSLPRKPARLTGAEMLVVERSDNQGLDLHASRAERLPFADKAFDTVICTHVIEHLLNYREAIAELRRIAAQRLIIVVPMERESLYGFNLHVNFFPYPHSFLRAMIPVPRNHVCLAIGRDIYYCEDIA